MDQSVAIQETLDDADNCRIAAQCVLLLDNGTESRLLGLVEHGREHALFMYSHRRMAISGDDVTLQEIIPISYNFSVVEVSSPDEFAVVGADTRVRITFYNEEVELKLPFGSHTRLFLSEINRAWCVSCGPLLTQMYPADIYFAKKNLKNVQEVCEQYPESPKLDWLNKYQKNSSLPFTVEPTDKFGKIGKL